MRKHAQKILMFKIWGICFQVNLVEEYVWICPPPQGSSHKWRFRFGFPSLVVAGILGRGVTPQPKKRTISKGDSCLPVPAFLREYVSFQGSISKEYPSEKTNLTMDKFQPWMKIKKKQPWNLSMKMYLLLEQNRKNRWFSSNRHVSVFGEPRKVGWVLLTGVHGIETRAASADNSKLGAYGRGVVSTGFSR